MYRNDYERTLERIKTASELSKDYSNMKKCDSLLNNYDRLIAWEGLQNLLREYGSQINFFGRAVDGVKLYQNVPLDSISDDELKNQLIYLRRHIPVYVLIRESESELAKRIWSWLNS